MSSVTTILRGCALLLMCALMAIITRPLAALTITHDDAEWTERTISQITAMLLKGVDSNRPDNPEPWFPTDPPVHKSQIHTTHLVLLSGCQWCLFSLEAEDTICNATAAPASANNLDVTAPGECNDDCTGIIWFQARCDADLTAPPPILCDPVGIGELVMAVGKFVAIAADVHDNAPGNVVMAASEAAAEADSVKGGLGCLKLS